MELLRKLSGHTQAPESEVSAWDQVFKVRYFCFVQGGRVRGSVCDDSGSWFVS